MSRAKETKRSGNGVRRFFVLLILLALVVFFLPTIVAKTSLRNYLLTFVVPDDAARITCLNASLGWWSAPVVRGVDVRDAAGQSVLTASVIKMDRTIWELVQDSGQLGSIAVESPAVYVRVRPDGSNLEDIIARLSGPADTESADPLTAPQAHDIPSFTLRIADATVVVQDVASGKVWRSEDVTVEFDGTALNQGLMRLSATGRVASGPPAGFGDVTAAAASDTGSFSLQLAPATDGRQQLDFRIESAPVAAAGPWLRRLVAEPQLGGLLTAEGTARWTPVPTASAGDVPPAGFESAGFMTIQDFDFATPGLAGDRVRLARVDVPWKVSAAGPVLGIDELAVNSAVGQIAARGAIDTSRLADGSATAAIERQDFEIRGSLNLARLAALLPAALRIREGTTITSGDLKLSLRSRPTAVGARVSGSVEATQLAATNLGQPIRWDQPMRAMFDASWQSGQVRVDALECEADFCRIIASGDDRNLEANARFDLDELARQLGKFVDLTGWQPAGTGTAKLIWQKTPDQRFVADGVFELDAFALAVGGRQVWAEPKLSISARSAGVVHPEDGWPQTVDSASVQIRAEQDSLDAVLRQVVDVRSPGTSWPVSIRASGDVGRWLARARPLVAVDDWRVVGEMDLTADVRAGAKVVELAQSQLRLTGLRAAGPGWQIDEPRVEFTGDLLWDGRSRRIESRSAQFVSSTASLAARKVQLVLPAEGAVSASGELAVRADLGRLAAMRAVADGPPGWQTTGMLAGNLQFDSRSDQVSGQLDLKADGLSLSQLSDDPAGGGYTQIWREPQLAVRGGMTYRRSSDYLSLDQFRITSKTLQLTTSGAIEKVSTTRNVNAGGAIDYDLQQITPLLKPYVGVGLQLVGREQARFEIYGPLATVAETGRGGGQLASVGPATNATSHWSRGVQARLQAPWQSATVYGLPIGEGKIVAQLGDGGVRFEPLSLAVGGGRLKANPFVRLDPAPAELTLPRGDLLTDVHISREVSDAMLKYIAPVLADATRGEGTFSMRLEGGRMPLGAPKSADVTGQLRMQSVDVLPGPATEQWVSLAQRVEYLIKNRDPQALVGRPPKSLLKIHDRTIPFRVVNGRVYHEGMEFYVGEVVVRSRGSVGFDQSLQMTLQVPVLDKWIDGTPALAGLRGRAVEIPVAGTLSQPRIDAGALTALSAQLLGETARGAIGGEINKALDKLFGK